ncbi:heme/copper-type cytochrome/quinol oxidase subunit 2 [Staphylococcus cohnii]
MGNPQMKDLKPLEIILLIIATILFVFHIFISFNIIHVSVRLSILSLSLSIFILSYIFLKQNSSDTGYICLTCALLLVILSFI